MKVKIGNTMVNSEVIPIMLILSSEEKSLISEMGEQTKFACFPKEYSRDEIELFIKSNSDK